MDTTKNIDTLEDAARAAVQAEAEAKAEPGRTTYAVRGAEAAGKKRVSVEAAVPGGQSPVIALPARFAGRLSKMRIKG